jgi:hypothetical protein
MASHLCDLLVTRAMDEEAWSGHDVAEGAWLVAGLERVRSGYSLSH